MNKLDEIHVVFAPDNHYVDYCCIAIESLLENYVGTNNINVYILDMGLDEYSFTKLEESIGKYSDDNIYFVNVDSTSIIREFHIKSHFTSAMYSRILIPNLLSVNISKVIYLDCDILIRKNIKELWEIDINEYALGAVSTLDFNNCEKLGINSDLGYFNSGVLIFNLNKWRKENYVDKTLEYLLANSAFLDLPDQDALNYVLCEDWVEIPVKWNVRTTLYSFDQILSYDKNTLLDPAIVHFTTSSKPWHYFNSHPFKEEYLKRLKKYDYRLGIPETLEKILHKDLIIFGAGSAGIKAKEIIEAKKHKICYFYDNDTSKFNKKVNGIEVRNPIEITESKDKSVIIIASTYENEIIKQLLSYGLIENEHFYRQQSFFSIKYDVTTNAYSKMKHF